MNTTAEAIRSFIRVRGPEADQLRADLCRTIKNLPDNPDIQQLGDGAFVIGSGDLHDNSWSPDYHDWKAQYDAVVDMLASAPFDKMLERLQKCIDDKAVGVGKYYCLHPGVITHLQQVIE